MFPRIIRRLWPHGAAAPHWAVEGVLALLLIGIASALSALLLSQPWRMQISVGGADSMALGGGFYAKEMTPTGRPFRWTNGVGLVQIPRTRSVSLLSVTVDSGRQEPEDLTIQELQCPLASFLVQPGFHTYRILWPDTCPTSGVHNPGAREITLISTPRRLAMSDDIRLLGVVVSEIQVRSLRDDSPPIIPFMLVGFSIGALAALVRPRSVRRILALTAAAVLLPWIYQFLVWNPPVAFIATWLPLTWLPWMVAAGLWSLVLARWAEQSPLMVGLAILSVGGMLGWLIASLSIGANVTGPDYGWHLNHGGSWERIFRVHNYYPFGFPLILWLGQLAGDHDILYGRITGLVSTLISAIATVALVWRMVGRRYAWLGAILLIGSPIFVAYGVLASTDAPFAAFATLSLLALCWSPQITVRQAVLAGLAMGVAYLFRFQAMMLMIPILLWAAPLRFADVKKADSRDPIADTRASAAIFFGCCPQIASLCDGQTPRIRWMAWLFRPAVIIALAFVVSSAPQWMIEIRDTGRPINSRQYTNIWNFAYGRSDAVPEDQPGGELWYVLSYDPAAIVRNWLQNIREFAQRSIHLLFVWPIGLLALIGAAMSLWQATDRRPGLLLIYSAIYVALVAIAEDKARFFLPIVPALVAFTAALLAQWHALLRAKGAWYAWLYPLSVALLWVVVLQHVLDAGAELAPYRV